MNALEIEFKQAIASYQTEIVALRRERDELREALQDLYSRTESAWGKHFCATSDSFIKVRALLAFKGENKPQ